MGIQHRSWVYCHTTRATIPLPCPHTHHQMALAISTASLQNHMFHELLLSQCNLPVESTSSVSDSHPYPRSVSESTGRGDSLTTRYVAEQQDCFYVHLSALFGIFCIGSAHIHSLCTWQFSTTQQYDNTLHQRDVLLLEEEEETYYFFRVE